ncbi:MAG TPA: Mur ligase family protein [Actinomycetota bacterium]|jgi:cyanophycin synthetase
MAPPADLRVLEGANRWFPGPAVELTLGAGPLAGLPADEAAEVAVRAGLPGAAAPGPPGSEGRRRFATRLAAHLVRRVAAEAAVARPPVRGRPGPGAGEVTVAWPWPRGLDAVALGRASAGLFAAAGEPDLAARIERAGRELRRVGPRPPPALPAPRIPVVAVTGTNGKTTVTRLVAHLGRAAGLRVGWCNTDGIYVDGELVEEGDWSGPGGAARVLGQRGVELAVLETARGGILRRGLGVAHNDVAVVTNVAVDHLGLGGVDTLDELAEVKAAVVRVTRPSGTVVLNAEDPRVLAMASRSAARPFLFALDPSGAALRAAVAGGVRAATVVDGDLAVLDGGRTERLLPVLDAPVTLAGISSASVANALAALAAGLGLGLPRAAVVEGLRSFRPDERLNPTRMNLFALDGRTVVVDVAHNEASLRALLEVCRGLRPAGAAVRIAIGTAGDRPDEVLRLFGELAARQADRVVIAEKRKYLRGRTTDEMNRLYREGASAAGTGDLPAFPTELAALAALLDESRPGDVCALTCHAERPEVAAWLQARGAAPVGDEQLRALATGAAAERSHEHGA